MLLFFLLLLSIPHSFQQANACLTYSGNCSACAAATGCQFCAEDLACRQNTTTCAIPVSECPADICSLWDADCNGCTNNAPLNCSYCVGTRTCSSTWDSSCEVVRNKTNSCSRCAYPGNCSACVNDPECGYCASNLVCYGGIPDKALYMSVNGQLTTNISDCSSAWQFTLCSDCYQQTSCADCSAKSKTDGCRWCYSQNKCVHKDQETLCSLVSECHDTNLSKLSAGISVWWLLVTGSIVFFMQCGFVMLEAGSIRVKNTKNILFKNVLDVSIVGLMYFLVGWGFSFGIRDNDKKNCPFIGLGNFALHGETTRLHNVFFQMTFCCASATIISGAVTERITPLAYACLSFAMGTVIYPVISHWYWSPDGWLFKMNIVDFAGSGVVHMTGGITALTAAILLGPRAGRFVEGKPFDFPGHSVALSAAGTLMLWFCWYSFNPGSSGGLTGTMYFPAARAALNTTLTPCVSGLITFFYFKLRFHEYNLFRAFNATLGGLAAITSGCASMDAYSACITGLMTALTIEFISRLMEFLQIDDPADAFAVHGGGGTIGMIATGLFARQDFLASTAGYAQADQGLISKYGLLYGGRGSLLGVQLLGIVVIAAYAASWSFLICFTLKKLKLLRITKAQEEAGVDKSVHGGFAYNPLEVKVALWIGQKNKG